MRATDAVGVLVVVTQHVRGGIAIEFWQGQVIGKGWMTLLALVLVIPTRRSLAGDAA